MAGRRGAGRRQVRGRGRAGPRAAVRAAARRRPALGHPARIAAADFPGAADQRPAAALAAVVPARPVGDAAERAAGQCDRLHQGPRGSAGRLPHRGARPGLPGLRGHRRGQRPDRRRGGATWCAAAGGRDRGVPLRHVVEPRPGLSWARNTGLAAASGRSSPTWTTTSTPTGTGSPSSRAASPWASGSPGSAGWCCPRSSTRPRRPVRAVRRAQQGPRLHRRGVRQGLARPPAPAVPAPGVRRRRVHGLRPGGAAADRRVRRGPRRRHARLGPARTRRPSPT